MPSIVEVKIKGVTPYTQSRKVVSEKLARETHDEYDKRVWIEKMHLSPTTGNVIIPMFALKNMLDLVAKQMSEKIVGKGNSTWTSRFATGVRCIEDLDTGIHSSEVFCEPLFVNADGVRGGGARVLRHYPTILTPNHSIQGAPPVSKTWGGTVKYMITNPDIQPEVFFRYMVLAGMNVGLGTHAPRNGGFKGTFSFERSDFVWRDLDDMLANSAPIERLS